MVTKKADNQDNKRNDLYFLEPISHIRDISKQIDEIDRRLNLLWDKMQADKLPIAPIHIVTTLGITKDVYNDWINGVSKVNLEDSDGNKNKVRVDVDDTNLEEERIRLIKARSALLTQWKNRAELTMINTASNPNNKGGQTGAIKMSEICYGYKSNDQLDIQVKADDFIERLVAWKAKQEKSKGV